jgi:hypothetical protein
MKIYVVKFFDEVGYCNEVVGYYSSQVKAAEAIASSEVEQDYWIDEVELDQAIEF